MRNIFLLPFIWLFILTAPQFSSAQGILGKIKEKVKQRANQRTDEAIDKALDKTEDAAKTDNSSSDNNGTTMSAGNAPVGIKSYANYDFVPGNKVIFVTQLADEQTGEIPSQFILAHGQADIQTEDVKM